MAGASLLALIDDIATLLDDVSVMTKVAAKKTAGVLGDDLALNAQQVSGVRAERELPVIWAVAVGSMLNKAILVPAALLISAVAPWAITPLLMLGGFYLCFEGVEKLAHKWLHDENERDHQHAELTAAFVAGSAELHAFERNKIRGAIRTDFILSAEIIVIALGTVAEADFIQRLAVLASVAALMTIGVYGLVAVIVKVDDLGLHLMHKEPIWLQALGRSLVSIAPKIMRFLSVAGTIAMFLVGGGILVHGISQLSIWLHELEHAVEGVLVLDIVGPMLFNALIGIVAGACVLGPVTLWPRVRGLSPE